MRVRAIRGASGGFLFSREKEPKRALIPLYALAVAKVFRTVTWEVHVGPSIAIEGPTDFLYLNKKICGAYRKGMPHTQAHGYCATSSNNHQVRVELKFFCLLFFQEK